MSTQPVYSQEAEEEVLAGALLYPELATRVAHELNESDFFDPRAKQTFRVIRKLVMAGNPVGPTRVVTALTGVIAQPGVYVADLIHYATTEGMAVSLMPELRRSALKREYDSVMARDTLTANELQAASELAQRIEAATTAMGVQEGLTLAQGVSEDLRLLEHGIPWQIPTGFSALDDKLGGFRKGQLITVAGRPGTGKSSLLLDFGLQAARGGHKTLFLTLEMTPEECRHRILAWGSGMPLSRFYRGGRPKDDEWTKLSAAAGDLAGLAPMFRIEQHGNFTVDQIANRIRGIGLEVVVVDYMQLLKGSGNPNASLYERITGISRDLKLLAKELDVVVIAGAQLNRQSEQRTNKRPMLSDLRDSGAVEQDSDVVMFTFREYSTNVQADPRRAELILAKNRQGPTAVIPLYFDPETTRFTVDFNRLLA